METKMICLALMVAAAAALPTADLTDAPVRGQFAAWKTTHNKVYATADEEANALAAYVENDRIIEEHNAKKLSWTLGHNEFSDMTWETFRNTVMSELFLNRNPVNARRAMLKTGLQGAADSVDWVSKGAVTAVKNQQRCGSCWAFSTTGSLEGAFAISNGTLTSFSEENLVQCDKVDDGCQGGLMDNAFKYIETNGLCTEADYPYTSGGGTTGTCKKTCSPAVTLTGFKDVPQGDEDALKEAVAKGPVSVAIEADKSAFQLYKSGILNNAGCGKQLDHGVLVVGYGSDSGTDYWKVKNSWGATWGEEGYIRMSRGNDMCGVATQPSYPTGAKKVGPGPGPGPSPPSPPADSHYEDPNTSGCQSDEIEITIENVDGNLCAPSCSLFKPCPTDVPDGVTAQPQCALQDESSGKKYCALICSPSLPILDQQAADDQCGENASCKSVQMGIGICTYDDSA